jgi:predicted nucleotidyltransferase
MFKAFEYLQNPNLAQQLAQLKQAWHIQDISVFGSAGSPKFHSGSDIDLLLDFIPGQEPSYFQLVVLQQELETLLQRKVDLVTRAGLRNSLNQDRAQVILNSCQQPII